MQRQCAAQQRLRSRPNGLLRQRARPLPAPRMQPGHGPGFSNPAWAESWSSEHRPSNQIGRLSVCFTRTKRATAALTETLTSFLPFPSLSHRRSRKRSPEKGSGTAAGPLVGARARPRLSAPSSSGLGDGALVSTHAAVGLALKP